MATVNELHAKIKEHFEEFDLNHAVHAEKGNKAAGTRVRKSMQAIKGLAQDVRVAVSAANKA